MTLFGLTRVFSFFDFDCGKLGQGRLTFHVFLVKQALFTVGTYYFTFHLVPRFGLKC